MPVTASQLPWVGNALNWHGQPYAQLQFTNSRAWIVHFTSVMSPSRIALWIVLQAAIAAYDNFYHKRGVGIRDILAPRLS